MPQYYPSLTPTLTTWALSQPIFFTASAPLHGRHINVSPKGMLSSTFSIFDPNHAAYIDATGSGIETVSHVYENGRVTIMFCSFDTKPGILRLFCKARVVEVDSPEFPIYLEKMGLEEVDGARAIVLLDIWKVQTSCGYSIPILTAGEPEPGPEPAEQQPKGDTDTDGTAVRPKAKATAKAYMKERTTLRSYLVKKVRDNALADYQVQWNARSLDGLPGLRAARRRAGEKLWYQDLGAKIVRAVTPWETLLLGMGIGVVGITVATRVVRQWGQ
ncbi:hypothetical protein VTN00DRAFT_3452 [Thermoascus crustaceus]|uniref:uncharacterized protein n=1 Tax=Thermoascus crustaceus TaxID=5088 RepID=UPI0037424132